MLSPMDPIIYLNRLTGQKEIEKVYGESALGWLYGDSWLARIFMPMLAKNPLFSALYGTWQKQSFTQKNIDLFIQKFQVDATEFSDPGSYKSFNDFFIRRLKPEARPIASGDQVAIIPADGRYYFYQNIQAADGFLVKGQKFKLSELLEDVQLAKEYEESSLVLARLCPSDYHRFHFPCSGLAAKTKWINGWLYSVNPIALRRDIDIFSKNKRTVCPILSPQFGKVLYIEVGATNVGSIHHTYRPNSWVEKGAEKGYFSFGASSLIILFPKDSILFDEDLIKATQEGIEIRCLMGQSMGLTPQFSS